MAKYRVTCTTSTKGIVGSTECNSILDVAGAIEDMQVENIGNFGVISVEIFWQDKGFKTLEIIQIGPKCKAEFRSDLNSGLFKIECPRHGWLGDVIHSGHAQLIIRDHNE